MKNSTNLITQSMLETSTEFICPTIDCNSTIFFPTMRVRKVSALMTGTGKPGIIPISGPLLCVKCHRELNDNDFGYIEKQEDKESSDVSPSEKDIEHSP